MWMFFFKQKTADEVRISDWSSDVCSSDLPGVAGDIAIAYCPERALPGRILVELIDNDRCIGGITPRCARKALGFYRQFVRGACITTSARAAEMVKLVENSFRDVNIAFANELSVIAERIDRKSVV